eukprot:12188828-Karenia_brevis.AAC.1
MLKATYPDKEWFVKKRAGVVSCDWTDVCKINIPSRDAEVELLWKHKAAADHGIDKDLIKEKFDSSVVKRDEELWCG